MSKVTAAARADINTVAAIKATSPQSQLAGLTGAVATINPQGDTARFVLADVRGKDAASAYRLSVIRTAVLELLKGNPRNLKEAIAMVAQLGKGKKARAYAAGFALLVDVRAFGQRGHFVGEVVDGVEETARVGKWTSMPADIRNKADTLADAYTAQFNSAHATVMAEKAAPKAKKAAAPATAASAATGDESAADTADSNTEASAPSMELDVGELVDGVVSAMQQGMLSAEEVTLLRAALAAIDATAIEGADAELHRLLTTSPVLTSAQAH